MTIDTGSRPDIQNMEMEGGEDKWKKAREKIIDFSQENGITAQELRVAYEIAMGISPDETNIKQPIREEIYTLAQMLDKMTGTEGGMPLNEIADLITGKQEYENAPNELREVITELDISDNEKHMLWSIVDKNRTGTLTLSNRDTGEDLMSLRITAELQGKKEAQNILASQLLFGLNAAQKKSGEQKIEATFEPS